jgi:hypothetical protein
VVLLASAAATSKWSTNCHATGSCKQGNRCLLCEVCVCVRWGVCGLMSRHGACLAVCAPVSLAPDPAVC